MGQRPANGLTAEADEALRLLIVRLREKLQHYDRRGVYGEVAGVIKITDGRFTVRHSTSEDERIESA